MKVGHKTVGYAKLKRRIDEEVGGACQFACACHGLKRSDRCCANTENPAACASRILNPAPHILFNAVDLLVHLMLIEILAFDGTECGISDMQCDEKHADTRFFYPFKQAVREVESGGGCSRRPVLRRKHRLIALLVKRCGLLCAALFGYIRRQRHKPVSPHRLVNIPLHNLNHKLPKLIFLQNANLECSITEDEDFSAFCVPTGADKAKKTPLIKRTQEEQFGFAACFAMSQKACLENASIV